MCQNCKCSSKYSGNIVEKSLEEKNKYTLLSIIKRHSANYSFFECQTKALNIFNACELPWSVDCILPTASLCRVFVYAESLTLN